jgi:hypothetical protein
LVFERAEAAPIPFHQVAITPPETLEEKADRYALKYEIATSTLRNLVYYESRWNPNAIGDHGCSHGLVQINLCAHKSVTKEQATDPDFALDFAASHIAKGEEYMWTPCNCFGLVKTKLGDALPRMADIQPNSEPSVGAVAVYDYNGLKHVAYVTNPQPDGFWEFGANLTPCKIESRFVRYDDPHLLGFFFPG